VFAALTAIGAWIFIPLPVTPVPITLQVFFVLLSGAVLGARLGALSQTIYVLMGLVGLPVFASAESGPAVLVGPTGGYLIGFIIGSYLTGTVAEHVAPKFGWYLIGALAGLIPIYSVGVLWLWYWLRSSFTVAFMAGAAPFIPVDVAKSILVAYVASRKQLRTFVDHRLRTKN
jgi:biotin transport system substrate-specific component